MDDKRLTLPSEEESQERLKAAIKQTAPGTALRHALDMIIAGRLGALICIGDTENVIAAGDDGFKLDISFTANRLFELSKMDGAIVIDKDFTQILRANYHLNPDPSLPTSETGMRHRTAARMSLLTRAFVISVSERRQVVTLYVDGTPVAWRQDALAAPFAGLGERVIGEGFKGLVDDVRIVAEKVSDDDIVSLMGASPLLEKATEPVTNQAFSAAAAKAADRVLVPFQQRHLEKDFLKVKVPFYDKGEATVLGHIQRALDFRPLPSILTR